MLLMFYFHISRNKTEGTIYLFGGNVNSKQPSYKGTSGTGQLTAGFSLGRTGESTDSTDEKDGFAAVRVL